MKNLIFTIILLMSAGLVSAQINRETELLLPNSQLGVQLGYNFAKIDSDLGANTVRRRAMHFSVFYQSYLSEKFALQPELQFSSEGWHDDEREATLKFLNLNMVGKYMIAGGLNLNGGIQAGLLLDATIEGNDLVQTYAIEENLKRFNVGAIFGLGYDFGFGLRLGGRYIQGLIDINDGLPVNSKDSEIKTTNFQVYIGYGFKLPKGDYGRAGNN